MAGAYRFLIALPDSTHRADPKARHARAKVMTENNNRLTGKELSHGRRPAETLIARLPGLGSLEGGRMHPIAEPISGVLAICARAAFLVAHSMRLRGPRVVRPLGLLALSGALLWP